MADLVTLQCWIGGDRPGDVLEQAKIRKAKGFTAVKVRLPACLPCLLEEKAQ